MNNSQQETPLDIQETQFGGAAGSKQRRLIHFSSGEILEQGDSEEEEEEEEEESPDTHPFRDPAERTRFSFRNVAILVGRISLLTCDFLGERLAGALGLNAAKYQYAIDHYHCDRERTSSPAAHSLEDGRAETIHLSAGAGRGRYGATADVRNPAESRESCDEGMKGGTEGRHNRGYEADESHLE